MILYHRRVSSLIFPLHKAAVWFRNCILTQYTMKDFERLIEKAVADGVVLGAVVCAKGTKLLVDVPSPWQSTD